MNAITKATKSCITFKEDKVKTKGVVQIYQDNFKSLYGCYGEIGFQADKIQVLRLGILSIQYLHTLTIYSNIVNIDINNYQSNLSMKQVKVFIFWISMFPFI